MSTQPSDDTLSVGSPWEKVPRKLKRKWRKDKKRVLAEDKFHDAMGLMDITLKPKKPVTVDSVKTPSLKIPTWITTTTENVLMEEPPHVGPQVPGLG